MSKITDAVLSAAKPIVEAEGCTVWDVEYVKEAGGWFLRLYIDDPDGVSINQCENISRALDPILDEMDLIPGAYTFEVSSAGAERQLKRPSDFEQFIGSLVEVRLYKSRDGKKEFVGTLKAYDNGDVTVQIGNEEMTFAKSEAANVRLHLNI